MGKTILAWALIATAWLGLGAVALLNVDPVADVHEGPVTVVGCESEDSCSVDYRDGSWHIEGTVP